jgi:hypothetical protein
MKTPLDIEFPAETSEIAMKPMSFLTDPGKVAL